MKQTNKQVIKDYFGSFFNQYKLSKEQFTKLRDLVDEAECGCCSVVTIYWVDSDPSATTPATQQINFKDVNDNILSSTSITGSSPQRICVPREATQICIDMLDEVTTGGTITIRGTDGFDETFTEAIGEECSTIEFPFADVYTITSQEP